MNELALEYRPARRALIELVKKDKGPTRYQAFSDENLLGFDVTNDPSDRKQMGEFLGVISEYEHENGRPLLSVLVQHNGMPGDGFFEMAERLGRYMPKFMTKGEFVKRELEYVNKYWKTHIYRL